MTFKIEHSAQAEVDLRNILDYISFSLHNPMAARDFFDEYNRKIQLTAENPHMYGIISTEHIKMPGLHKMPIDSYIMVYKIDEDKRRIMIMRIFNQRQNYFDIL